MKKSMKLLLAIVMVFTCVFGIHPNVNAASSGPQYGGAKFYFNTWRQRRGILFASGVWDVYNSEAYYKSSFIVLLEKLSDTIYWGNYKNMEKSAQSLTLGVSKSTTVSKTNAWTITGSVGKQVPSAAETISKSIGGSYTRSKTYTKTVGTSSAYLINTESKNGYYCVTHAQNCDCYNITVYRNDKLYSTGEMIRYQSDDGYQKLWWSSTPF